LIHRIKSNGLPKLDFQQ
jgi:hypothetical protein